MCRIIDSEQLGRSPDSILRTHVTLPLVLGETPAAIAAKQEGVPTALREMFRSGTLEVTPPEAIAHYRALVQAGMQYFIIGVWPNDGETLQLFSQHIAPALAL